MDKNVIISVKGTQSSNDQVENILELVTEGKYYKKDKAYFVTYDESEVTGMSGTTTTLKVLDGIVTLIRVGSVNSQFVFQQGQKHVSYYDTEFGAFTVGVTANEVDVRIDDSGGEIKIGYHLEIDNNETGENDFCMSIREARQSNDKLNRKHKGTGSVYS
ncbi:MAG: DUF1934 domain-containing protein [Clostridiaceae bacterium]|jgi:uncharacterized beta-barrel protein YwiB (DUF1934 family)|nr:DUF1934 domain-containing protein [Clostridiaceae bacterium]